MSISLTVDFSYNEASYLKHEISFYINDKPPSLFNEELNKDGGW